jgi:hypothetical protein
MLQTELMEETRTNFAGESWRGYLGWWRVAASAGICTDRTN